MVVPSLRTRQRPQQFLFRRRIFSNKKSPWKPRFILIIVLLVTLILIVFWRRLLARPSIEQFFLEHSPDTPAIFYNIYTPSDKQGIHNAIRIVHEQVQQIHASSLKSAPVYYNTIGETLPNLLKESHMQHSTCPNCIHMQHYTQQSEVVTLSRLYDFCRIHPNQRVVYLHSKGSYHKHRINENWRRHLTMAALSDLCWNHADDECHVCGLHFFTQWTLFFPGNIWTAQCSYIHELLPPTLFESKLTDIIGKVLLMRLRNQLTTLLFPDRLDRFGLDRYSTEHWVGSHPSLQACDVAPTSLKQWLLEEHSIEDMEWSKAPRHVRAPMDNNETAIQLLQSNPTASRREYYYLAGHLLKWYGLYRKLPPTDSWVWDWFPQGREWQRDVMNNGGSSKVVQAWTRPTDLDGNTLPSGLFAPNGNASQIIVPLLDSSTESNEWTIFYEIFIPKDNEAAALRMAGKQIDILKQSAEPNIKVFFNTMGTEEFDTTSVKAVCTDRLSCQHMQHYSEDYPGETLSRLHAFCRAHPSSRVSYLHNRIDRDVNEHLIKQATVAVTNQACVKLGRTVGEHRVRRQSSMSKECNLCGLAFSVMPYMHMSGSMWTADCDYINRLPSPSVFVNRMNQVVVKTALVMKLRTKFTMNLFPERMDYLGIDRYALNQWVGSDPSIQPCDLLVNRDLRYWSSADLSAADFEWRMAPRESLVSEVGKSYEQFGNVTSLRIREYYMLAGRVFTWFLLYDSVPQKTSWIWQWFPDGHKWLIAVLAHKEKAVDEMTKEFATTKV